MTTLLLGGDWTGQRSGAALIQSWGRGSCEGDNNGADGEISSTATGLFPYGRHALTPQLGLWAIAGYGWGNSPSTPMVRMRPSPTPPWAWLPSDWMGAPGWGQWRHQPHHHRPFADGEDPLGSGGRAGLLRGQPLPPLPGAGACQTLSTFPWGLPPPHHGVGHPARRW